MRSGRVIAPLPRTRVAFDGGGSGHVDEDSIGQTLRLDGGATLGTLALAQGTHAGTTEEMLARQQLDRIRPRHQAHRALDVVVFGWNRGEC